MPWGIYWRVFGTWLEIYVGDFGNFIWGIFWRSSLMIDIWLMHILEILVHAWYMLEAYFGTCLLHNLRHIFWYIVETYHEWYGLFLRHIIGTWFWFITWMLWHMLEEYLWYMVYGCYVSYMRYILALCLMNILAIFGHMFTDIFFVMLE